MAEYTLLAMALRTNTTLAGMPVKPLNARHLTITLDVARAPGKGGLILRVVAPTMPPPEAYDLVTVMRDSSKVTKAGLYRYILSTKPDIPAPDDRYTRTLCWAGVVPRWWTVEVVHEDNSPYLYGVTFDTEEVDRG